MAHRRCNSQSKWHAVVLVGALAGAGFVPDTANAGFFDFLFGNSQDQPQQPEPYAPPPAPGIGRVAPAPLGTESIRQGGDNIGHVIAYCVRLCDGEHFPIEHLSNATPIETCRAMCPASKTKVFYGSEIGSAVAKDGAHYADLNTAFIYRKQLVANCTCNGRNPLGLAHFDLSTDPTLRQGDIVSTSNGLMAYAGKNGKVDAFTPVDPSSIAAELNSVTSNGAVAQRKADVATGTTRQSMPALPAVDRGANMHGQGGR